MKYAILTPTYKNHFCYITKYLKSIKKYALDIQNFDIIFVVEKEDGDLFNNIIQKYDKYLNINVFYFEDVLAKLKINVSCQELLNKYGRFTYQTFKKLYAMLYGNYDYYLVLDSESMFLRKTNISALFENYFSNPFLSGTKLDPVHRTNLEFNLLCDNINYLLKCNNQNWFLEDFLWFYDKKILQKLFSEHGSLIKMAQEIYNCNKELCVNSEIKYGIFEICLYRNYLYNNRKRFGYTYQDITEYLNTISPSILQQYLASYYGRCRGTCGVIEHALIFLNKKNYKPLANLFKQLNLSIIRCDETTKDLYLFQRKFLQIVKPNILAASQEHCFGLNSTIKNRYHLIFDNNKYLKKLKQHWDKFIIPFRILGKFLNKILFHPFYVFLLWLFQPLPIIKYTLKFFLKFIKNLRLILLG